MKELSFFRSDCLYDKLPAPDFSDSVAKIGDRPLDVVFVLAIIRPAHLIYVPQVRL